MLFDCVLELLFAVLLVVLLVVLSFVVLFDVVLLFDVSLFVVVLPDAVVPVLVLLLFSFVVSEEFDVVPSLFALSVLSASASAFTEVPLSSVADWRLACVAD